MHKLNSVFWDLDGTIADTELDGHRIAFNKAFKEYGLDWTWDLNLYPRLLTITGGKNRIKYYSGSTNIHLNDKQIGQVHAIKQRYYSELVENRIIKFRHGVKRLITELSSNNIKQYIVTTSSQSAVIAIINSEYSRKKIPFTGWITGDDVSRLKPHPEAYIKATKTFKCNPDNVLVIEDSLPGYLSARSAKLNCLITLTSWWQGSIDDFGEALAIVSNLGEDNNHANIIKGKPLQNGKINLDYLSLM